MLKIGLLGYGKMGKAIEQLAENQGIEIVWRISRENLQARNSDLLRSADVVIEFSRPEAAFGNVMACLEAGVPVVSGTTGWMDNLPAAQTYCQKKRRRPNLGFQFQHWCQPVFRAQPLSGTAHGPALGIPSFPCRNPPCPQIGCSQRHGHYLGK